MRQSRPLRAHSHFSENVRRSDHAKLKPGSAGAHALIILRQGGLAHHAQTQAPPLVPLPPACPELNAAENIWQYLRQTYLSNRLFENYTAILDACQFAWRSLLNELGRIKSIASRDWAATG